VDVQAIRPGDTYRPLIVGDGRRRTKLSRRENAGFPQIAFAGTYAAHPDCEKPYLVKGVEVRDLEPITREHIAQDRVDGGSLAQLLKHHLRCPAFFINQEISENVQPLRPGKVAQAHCVENPDRGDGGCRFGHGARYASAPAGRSAAVICPCISSTALAAVSRPLLHASMTACA